MSSVGDVEISTEQLTVCDSTGAAMSAKLCRYPGECQGKKQGGCEFRAECIFTIPRPGGRSLGVHGFGTEQ